VRAGIAVKPAEYAWRQLAGAEALAGRRFPRATDFSAAKIAVFAASILSAVGGTALLWGASRQELIEEAPQSAGMQGS
jgi:NhaA family Na+:H+ antiporter